MVTKPEFEATNKAFTNQTGPCAMIKNSAIFTGSMGLERVREIHNIRDKQVKWLKGQGQKIIGYVCSFAPPEIISAAGLVPYRLTGKISSPLTKVDAYLESTACPYVRNLFDQALKGSDDFVDGLVLCHSCDSVLRVSGLFAYYITSPYFRVVNVPHNLSESSLTFFKSELIFFKESLEKLTGNEISSDNLRQTVQLYNDNRALVRGLYELRKQDPPLMTGSEMMQLLVAGVSIPATKFNALLREVTQEVKSRGQRSVKKPRVMIYGCILDSDTFPKLVEDSGADIVVDDTCIGTRTYWHDVPETPDIFDGLVKCYLEDFVCPRTGRPYDYGRFQYLKDFIRDFKVDGVILYALQYCDPHKIDIPSIRDFLAEDGLPTLYIEDDYTISNFQAIKTRVQAFLEMIG